MNLLLLFKYNFRVLMLNNWWLLVFPIAVTQLSVFWSVVTEPKFKIEMAAQTVERITPLLAAFLGAHLLSAEYRSRIGAVLASRPVSIGKIVLLRMIVMLAVVWGLAWISLQAFATWMEPFPTDSIYLAMIPSTLFLTMLALTFATVFRNSLAGFGIASIYWVLDLPPGAPLNPYLSLRSLTTFYSADAERMALAQSWSIAKWILLAAAILLYLYHNRLVFGLGTAQTLRTRRRALLAYAFVLVFYVVSGAMLKVRYGYENRGKLLPNDVTWFRYQFASYGPIPVASLFGSGFTRFLGEFANPWRAAEEETDRLGDTVKHRRDLLFIQEQMKTNPWAPSAADAYARLEARKKPTVEEQVAVWRSIVDRYPNSPYVEHALRSIALRYNDANRPNEARATYEELLRRIPNTQFKQDAESFLNGTPSQG